MKISKIKPMKENKKGIVMEILAVIIIGFIMILFFAGWTYGVGLVNDQLKGIQGDGSNVTNISNIASQNFGYYYNGIDDGLKLISAVLLIVYMLATLIIAYYSPESPIMYIVYFIIAAVFVVFSIYIGNAYEGLVNEGILGGELTRFTIGNHIMMNLSMYVLAVTVIGIILMIGGSINRGRTI